jgi:hypothetical protein
MSIGFKKLSKNGSKQPSHLKKYGFCAIILPKKHLGEFYDG